MDSAFCWDSHHHGQLVTVKALALGHVSGHLPLC